MSCSDVQTIKAGNGSQLTFSFDFPYIFKSEIHVYFWNATTKEWDEKLTTDSTFPWQITDANPTIVEFTGTAPPSPAAPSVPNETTEDNVRIRRITKVDDIRALFNPGSAIRSDDLNKNFEQLRFAIQESNCQGIPDDVDEYLKEYYWNKFDETVYSTETWDSDDDQVATTQAIDARIDSKIDSALTVDIIGADGINVQDDTPGSGQITVGLSDDSVDFDKIKDADQIKLADQVSDPTTAGTDDKVFTASAAVRRFESYYQNSTPSTTDGIGVGQVWVDPDDDLTLSVWTGSAWSAITSGGTFTNQPKVVYVDASSGSDDNDGHRISRPKQTIKAAVNQINADSTFGDGSVVIVAAGVYQEAAPIQIQKKNVSIIGQALRSCIVHPTVATQGDQSAGNHALFELNSGSFIQNLTLTGMKAGSSGTNTVDSVLPAAQGWNFAFLSGATITKSPYIQNCTNFSDSEINNSNLNANTPAGGLAGDTDSAPTGGGMLVDGSVVATASPLRSMVADSYTHVGLNGPGILVTNNGYAQCTSSYAFFNKYHIKTLNGGQANLAASTTDFGDLALVADGKSTAAIFTSNVDGAASSGAISFNVNEPTAGVGWFGDTERPATNMLVEVNSVIYPILSATANTDSEGGSGWTVTISRPDPNNRSTNLGLDGAISDNADVSFYLRSMIASSGHTMEYVGSGTDYRALPENGGVPNETKQITESNNGKVWTAITDHNGKFKIGGNQTDDPIFEVDQQLGFVTIPEGSIAFNLLSDLTPQLGGNLDVNGNEIVTDASNENIVLNPHGTGAVNVSSSKIINVTDPTDDQDAATKKYVDDTVAGIDELIEDATPQLGGNLDVNGNEITSASNGDVTINPNGTGDIVLDANVGIGISSPTAELTVDGDIHLNSGNTEYGRLFNDAAVLHLRAADNMELGLGTEATERLRIDSSGDIDLFIAAANNATRTVSLRSDFGGGTFFDNAALALVQDNSGSSGGHLQFLTTASGGSSPTERLRIDSSGNVIVGTSSTVNPTLRILGSSAHNSFIQFADGDSNNVGQLQYSHSSNALITAVNGSERMRIDSSGNVGIGTSSPATTFVVEKSDASSTTAHILVNNSQSSSGVSLVGAGSSFSVSGWPGITDAGIIRSSAGSSNGLALHSPAGFTSFWRGTGTAVESMRIDSSGNLILKRNADVGNILQINGADTTSELFEAGITSGHVQFTATHASGGSNTCGFIFRTRSPNLTTERMRLDSSGRLLLGHSSSVGDDNNLQLVGSTADESSATFWRSSSDAGNPQLNFVKTRGSVASPSIVSNGDTLGRIRFYGYDGLDSDSRAAEIVAKVDGTPGGDDMPGRLEFHTTSDGARVVSERMRIDSNGRVGIGTTSPSSLIHGEVSSGSATLTLKSTATSGEASVSLTGENSSGTARTAIFKYDNSDLIRIGTSAGIPVRFETNDLERMRITSSGNLLIGQTNESFGTVGQVLKGTGQAFHVVSGDTCLFLNRKSSDGELVRFAQDDGTEGSITVSGSTVSYNGGHLSRWSQLAGGTARTEILRGSVLSNLDEMCEWAHAAQDAVLYTEEDELPKGVSVGDVKTPAVDAYTENNEQLNRMKVSDVEGDPNVAGVFQDWDDDDDTYTNDFYCAMTGDFVIRIAQGTTVARGDLLMSAGDGTAKPQDDDIVRSKTIAKVTSTTVSTTYSDGSYCVPCVLMAC